MKQSEHLHDKNNMKMSNNDSGSIKNKSCQNNIFFHENIIGLLDRGRAVTSSYNFTLAFDAFSHDILISKPGKQCLNGITTGCSTVLYRAGQELAVLFHRGLRICIISTKDLVKEIKSMSIISEIWHHSERAANILDQNDPNKLKNSKNIIFKSSNEGMRAGSVFHGRKT